MKDVAGRTAFITGGSSGIGLGIARAFFDAGMNICLGYRTPKHLTDAMTYFEKNRARVHAINVDVADRPAMEKAAVEVSRVFGNIHVVVNNAGIAHSGKLSDTTYDDWDWTMAVNLDGVFNTLRAFLPRMRIHGEGGHLISTSSVLGLFAASGNLGAYTASKFAVVGLMEALRCELAETNIGVSVLCPGPVRSRIKDSNRNRQSRFLSDRSMPKSSTGAVSEGDVYMEPLEAGRLVLQGMRENDLYILTHPEYEPIIRMRNDALLASIRGNQHISNDRMSVALSAQNNSIYLRQTVHRRCALTNRGKE